MEMTSLTPASKDLFGLIADDYKWQGGWILGPETEQRGPNERPDGCDTRKATLVSTCMLRQLRWDCTLQVRLVRSSVVTPGWWCSHILKWKSTWGLIALKSCYKRLFSVHIAHPFHRCCKILHGEYIHKNKFPLLLTYSLEKTLNTWNY